MPSDVSETVFYENWKSEVESGSFLPGDEFEIDVNSLVFGDGELLYFTLF